MVRKKITAYGFQPPYSIGQPEWLAKFDVLNTEFVMGPELYKVKAINPNITIVGYRDVMAMHTSYPDWAEVNTHEDWFLHDVKGNRLVSRAWGWYAMDVGNDGWRAWYTNQVKAWLDNYPFDGVFADDVWPYLWAAGDSWSPWANPIEDVPASIRERWVTDMVGFIRYVKARIGNKLLILNCTPDAVDYINAADGYLHEEFVHPDRYGPTEFYDDYIRPQWCVQQLDSWSRLGKQVWASSGCSGSEPPELLLYCLCAFLLGMNQKATFSWGDYYKPSKGYFPEMDVNLGNPRGTYYVVNADVWGRDFDNAKVFVNFSATTPYTITVDGNAITLPTHSGYIMPTQPAPIVHSLIITATAGGSTSPVVGTYNHDEGTSAVVTAIPDASYRFVRWELDGTIRTENPITVLMNTDYSLRAIFEALPPPPPEKCYLTIVAINGQTDPVPGTYSFNPSASITVTCTPNSGYRFKEWLLDSVLVSTSTSYTVTMNANHSLVAVSEQIPPPVMHTLFINTTLGGTTYPIPGTYNFLEGTVTGVVPIPNNGYRFVNWILDGQTRTDNPINVTMDADHSLEAVFELLPIPPPEKCYLTIVAINGQTNPTPNTYEVDVDTTITVTATPNSGYKFKEWLLDNVQAGTEPFITVTMDVNHTLVALFEKIQIVQAGFPIWVIPVALLGAGVLYLAGRKK